MSNVEIGLGLQSDKRPGEYARLARAAEAFGVDVLTVFGDLMFQPPLPALLEMAEATSAVRLGPACLNPYSMHPYEIAGQVACLDLVSGGRAYLGLARGTWLGAVGMAQPHPVTHLRDAAGVVTTLLQGNAGGYNGEVFSIEPGTVLQYSPERPAIPLLIGTWGPRTAALAGHIADEVKIGGTANPAMVPVMRDRIAVGTTQAGRDVGDVGIVVGAVTVVDEDGDAARARARTEVAIYLAVVAELDPTADVDPQLLNDVKDRVAAGAHKDAGSLIPDAVLDLFAFSGTPEQVAHQAQQLIDVGVSRVEFGTPQGLQGDHGVDLIGTRVIPLLDRRGPK